MDLSKVVAIFFAEVGAQGSSNYVAAISDDGERIHVDEGRFSFTFEDRCIPGDVEIEVLEEKIPFLAHFRGTSYATTCRGHFAIPGGEWFHFDAGWGNHVLTRIRASPRRKISENFSSRAAKSARAAP